VPVTPQHQLDLFPERIYVERLDPREAIGGQTRVRALYAVRFEREDAPHQIFLDRHGWYCADHGPRCRAVREVTRRPDAPAVDR
jgi:hypothetical protein